MEYFYYVQWPLIWERIEAFHSISFHWISFLQRERKIHPRLLEKIYQREGGGLKLYFIIIFNIWSSKRTLIPFLGLFRIKTPRFSIEVVMGKGAFLPVAQTQRLSTTLVWHCPGAPFHLEVPLHSIPSTGAPTAIVGPGAAPTVRIAPDFCFIYFIPLPSALFLAPE